MILISLAEKVNYSHKNSNTKHRTEAILFTVPVPGLLNIYFQQFRRPGRGKGYGFKYRWQEC